MSTIYHRLNRPDTQNGGNDLKSRPSFCSHINRALTMNNLKHQLTAVGLVVILEQLKLMRKPSEQKALQVRVSLTSTDMTIRLISDSQC